LREALIHWFEMQKILKRKEAESDESYKTFKALVTWVNGDEFGESTRYIDDARKAAERTRSQLTLMRNYVNTQIDKATKFQNLIEQNLTHTKNSIGKLRELLNSGS
jgi:hypothetical protein